MSNFEKVKTFMTTYGQEVKESASFPDENIIKLRLKLIKEELEDFYHLKLVLILLTLPLLILVVI